MLILNRILSGESVVPVTLSFTAFSNAGVVGSPHTFSAFNIGTAAPDRHVVVCAVASNAALATGSCTVAGQSTTRVTSSSAGGRGIAIFVTDAAVTTGTTADIIVTVGATSDLEIHVYELAKASNTTTPTVLTDNTDPLSVSATIQANGASVAVAALQATAGGITWAGLTERSENSSANFDGGSASGEFATLQSGLTVSASNSSSGHALCVASWEPV